MGKKTLSERHGAEADFFDRAIQGGSRSFPYNLGILAPADRCADGLLGNIGGKRILDFGCGSGWNAVRFAQQGAKVWAFDISEGMVEATRSLALEKGVAGDVEIALMAAEQMTYGDSNFDLLFGHSILHHLDLELARDQIHRVLREQGKAVFVEPLAGNLFIDLFRRLTPNRRTRDERPLTQEHLDTLRKAFRRFSCREFFLFSVLALVLAPLGRRIFQWGLTSLVKVDDWFLSRFPALRKYCWVVVIEMVK